MEYNRQVVETILSTGTLQSFSVSAFRSSAIDFNTTDHLIQAGESETTEDIINLLSKVSDFHTELLEGILIESNAHLRPELIVYAKHLFDEYKSGVLASKDLKNCTRANDYTIGV